MGKSRLLYEFDDWLELRPEQIFFFKGRGTLNTRNVPYSLFRDLFANRFDILESDSIAVALDKFRGGMAGVLEADLADVIGHWLGFDFSSSEAVQRLLGGSGLMETARAFLMRYFRALAANEPTVVFLEDLHWADDPSLDLAAYLATALPEAQLLIVAVTRPSLFERRPNWGEGQAAFRRIPLMPLSKRTSRALVDEILKRVEQVPDALRDLITDAAEGNPFYVEEMVKMLIEQGVIDRSPAPATPSVGAGLRPAPTPAPANADDTSTVGANLAPALPPTADTPPVGAGLRPAPTPAPATASTDSQPVWRVRVDKLAELKVPPTLTALLQARLDGLPQLEREALQRASVVGRLFWDDAVADLLEVEREAAGATLESVRGRELIFRREHSAFAGADEYIFKHALLRDVAYETVLLKRRKAYHARAARWLEQHAGERRDEYLTLIAEHYIQAGEGLQAADLLERAAMEADSIAAYTTVRSLLERALALREAAGQTTGPEVTAALLQLGWALWRLGDLPAATVALEHCLAQARTDSDAARSALALARLALVLADSGLIDRARMLADEAQALGRQADVPSLPDVLVSSATVALISGDLVASGALAEEARALALQVGDGRTGMRALNELGKVAINRGDLEQADEYYQELFNQVHAQGDVSFEIIALCNLAYIAGLRGNFASARGYAQRTVAQAQELGEKWNMLVASLYLSLSELKLGEVVAAKRAMREVLVLAQSLGMPTLLLGGLMIAAQVLVVEDQTQHALALFGLARVHPALDSQIRLEIDDALAKLSLPVAEVEAGLATGAALDLETVVAEILEGKW